jgi:hypothetical protein
MYRKLASQLLFINLFYIVLFLMLTLLAWPPDDGRGDDDDQAPIPTGGGGQKAPVYEPEIAEQLKAKTDVA